MDKLKPVSKIVLVCQIQVPSELSDEQLLAFSSFALTRFVLQFKCRLFF